MTPAPLHPGSAHFHLHLRPLTVPISFVPYTHKSAATSLFSKGNQPLAPVGSRLTGVETAVGSAVLGSRRCALHLRLRFCSALATVFAAAGPRADAGQRRPRLPHWLRAREGRGRGGNLGRVEPCKSGCTLGSGQRGGDREQLGRACRGFPGSKTLAATEHAQSRNPGARARRGRSERRPPRQSVGRKG